MMSQDIFPEYDIRGAADLDLNDESSQLLGLTACPPYMFFFIKVESIRDADTSVSRDGSLFF